MCGCELHCLLLRLITVCSLTAVIVRDDVKHMLSLSALTVADGRGLRDDYLSFKGHSQTCEHISASIFKNCNFL